MAEPGPRILCLTARGATLAHKIRAAIGGEVHGLDRRTDADITFDAALDHIRMLFAAGHPIVGVCAAGILIRAAAPLLADKHSEPPVLSVAEDGSAVVPLLGGHHGANRLAIQIAAVLGTEAAITTASDVVHGTALDDPPAEWRLADPSAAGAVTADLLAGKPARLSGHTGHSRFLDPIADLAHVTETPRDQESGQSPARITLSILADDGIPDPDRMLCYDKVRFTLGVGCARGCPPEELAALVQAALAGTGLGPAGLAGVFSLDLKADEAAVLDLADTLNLPARFFGAAELEAQTPRLANPSDVVFAEVGCHGVAEAAALAAAGPMATLIVAKQKSANATAAIAQTPAAITALPGRQRGQVSLIGIGPGQADWRTPEASRLVAAADILVGYGLYIDLLGPLAASKPRADFPLGGEEDRCRYALEQAALGRHVGLICSGDAGIYAMGALVYEMMARPQGLSDAARRVAVVTAPGISALQAAAARAGAPLGHDFCAISLSDLLTPRSDIERRLRAAAEGDFVIALYNPVSKRRRDLFPWAQRLLLTHRPADTPVVLASSLGRPEEHVRLRPLAEIATDEIDMLTTVVIGSSQSRLVQVGGRDRVFTPRGYAAKHERQAS